MKSVLMLSMFLFVAGCTGDSHPKCGESVIGEDGNTYHIVCPQTEV